MRFSLLPLSFTVNLLNHVHKKFLLQQVQQQNKQTNQYTQQQMRASPIQFKKFRPQPSTKNLKTKMNIKVDRPNENNQQLNRNKIQFNAMRSPQKPPTSFRQLSGSKDKNKLFSGKKNALENKLNTLRSNQKISGLEFSSYEKINEDNFGSDKKEGLFKKLLSSRSPHPVKKNLGFQDSNGSTLGTNDSSRISFSAFKGIILPGQNQNTSNFPLKKYVSSQQQAQDKGLKFKNFPHKRTNINNQNKSRINGSPKVYISEGPLISEKSRSKNKNQKQSKQDQVKKSKPSISSPFIINNPKPTKKSSYQYENNEYGLRFKQKSVSQESDEVIRSREGSMTFDMSPTIC